MDPHGTKLLGLLVQNPPHVVIGRPGLFTVLGIGGHVRPQFVAHLQDGIDPGSRDHLLAAELAAVANHHAEARRVPQSGVHATGRHGHIGPVHRDVGVVLGSQPGPQVLLQEILQRLPAYPRYQPPQYVGIAGVVIESLTRRHRRIRLDELDQEIMHSVNLGTVRLHIRRAG